MKALIIPVDGKPREVAFDRGASYEVLRNAVGGYIECVALSDTLDMWVNEDGKLISLPINSTATFLWTLVYGPTDVIVGDVIFTGGVDDEGETLGLSDDQIERLLAFA